MQEALQSKMTVVLCWASSSEWQVNQLAISISHHKKLCTRWKASFIFLARDHFLNSLQPKDCEKITRERLIINFENRRHRGYKNSFLCLDDLTWLFSSSTQKTLSAFLMLSRDQIEQWRSRILLISFGPNEN